ncbi:MAG: ornithine cyclodeaminase family protein [Candidatus Eremiobacteraeota bacterium]|nr:ornithine cyclodeaminase family protein [Candidatus Eremiobacteraeota bacterium]
MLSLTEPDVRAVLRWDELIPAMERALIEFSSGHVVQPMRHVLTLEEDKRYFLSMPAATQHAMGLKAVTVYPANEGTDMPTHTAMILLFDPATGEPLAAMDARLITEMRTAAVSAALTNRLASRKSRILALLGSGVQAKAHLEALQHIRDFQEVRVHSPTPAHQEAFARAYGAKAMDAESAVRGADVIVTATTSTQPILMGNWLKPGAHVNAIGAPRPTWRELDDEAMQNKIIADSQEAVAQEAGDVILSKAKIYAEAGEILSGAKQISTDETTIFKSVGLAAEDIVAAKLVYDRIQANREHPPA